MRSHYAVSVIQADNRWDLERNENQAVERWDGKGPQIADTLFISRKTVEHHLSHIYSKLGVSCRTSAVAYAIQN